MASIFSLFGEIFIDNEKANKSVKETTKEAEKSGGSLGKVGKVAGVMGAAVLTGATAAVTGLVSMTNKAVDNASAISDASQRAGVSAEMYQKYAYAAKLSGMETEQLENAMKKQQKAFADAKSGSKTAGDAYKKLGLDISKIGDSGEAFDQVVKKLADIKDPTERNAIAMDIFGKSYADLNPLLNEGAEGIQNMTDEAEKMGAVMSNEAVAAGDNLGDSIDKIKMAGAGIVNNLGASLIPLVQTVADLIIQNMPFIQGLFQQLAPVITGLLANLLPPMISLAQTIFPILLNVIQMLLPFIMQIMTTVLPIIVELIQRLLPPIMQIVQQILPILIAILMPLLDLLMPIIDALMPIIDLVFELIQPLLDVINMILPPLAQMLNQLIKLILPPLTKAFSAVAKVVSGVFKNSIGGLKPIIEGLKKILGGLIEFISGVFSGDWGKAWEGIKGIFGGIWESLKGLFKIPINWIIDGLNLFLRGLNKITIPDWVPLIGGKGFHINELPRLKVGLDYVASDNMPALLHKGERVLTAEQNKAYSMGSGAGGYTINIGTFINNRTQDVKQFAEELEFYRRQIAAAQGA